MAKEFPGDSLYAVSLHSQPHIFLCNDKTETMAAQGIPPGQEQQVLSGSLGFCIVKDPAVVCGIEQSPGLVEAGVAARAAHPEQDP